MTKREWQIEMANRFAKRDNVNIEELDTKSYLLGRYDSTKELTDEEIKSEAKYFCHNWYSQNPEKLVLFARAILRKAQDK